MKLKGIQPRNGESLSGTAYKISRSISKKGIKANPYLKNIKKTLPNYLDDIKAAIIKDLNIKNTIETKLNSVENKHIQFKKK